MKLLFLSLEDFLSSCLWHHVGRRTLPGKRCRRKMANGIAGCDSVRTIKWAAHSRSRSTAIEVGGNIRPVRRRRRSGNLSGCQGPLLLGAVYLADVLNA